MKSAAVTLITQSFVLLVLAGSAQAQISCTIGSNGTPPIRGEGTTELVADVVIFCTGGTTNTNTASPLPTVNLTVTFPQPVTSRLIGPNGLSDALLLIDEPGTGIVNAAQPIVCPSSASGCPAFPNVSGIAPVMTASPSALGSPGAFAANVYQGIVNSNAVTFFGVPILPPGTTSQRILRVTNVRINASAAPAGPVIGMVAISDGNGPGGGAVSLFGPVAQNAPQVGVVQSSLSVGSTNMSFSNCNLLNYVYAGNVTFVEKFSSAFRTRVTPTAAANSGQSNAAVQTVPVPYNSESGYEIAVPQTNLPAGLADFGTRLKAIFTNIPSGVRVFVSFANMTGVSLINPGTPSALYNSASVGNNNTGSLAELLVAEGAPDTTGAPVAAPLISTGNTGPAPAGTPYFELPVSGGTATAVWEVLNTNPAAIEAFSFDVWLIIPQGPTGTAVVNASYAPTDGAAGGLIPAFIDPNLNAPKNAFGILLGACGPTGTTVSTLNTSGLPAPLATPLGVAVDSAGNVFVADTNSNINTNTNNGTNRVVMITPSGNASVVAGLTNQPPFPNYAGDGGLAVKARLFRPNGVAVDSSGAIYVADTGNNVIRKFTVNGNISTVAGNGSFGFTQDGIPATSASLGVPNGVAVDSSGNVYIADTNNNRIRMVQATTHQIITVAGTGSAGFSGDGGPPTLAMISFPTAIAVDSAGNIYFTDSSSRVRKFTVGGPIITVAGGNCCGSEPDGPATAGPLNNPNGLAVDAFQNLFIAESGSNRVRMVSGGTITTVAGAGAPASANVPLSNPQGVAVDSHGVLYVSDTGDSRVQRVVLYQGSVSLGPVSGPPGGTVQIPLTATLNPGAILDTLGLTIQVSSGSGTLTFNQAAGISPPTVSVATVPGTIVLGWTGNLSSGAPLSGSFPLGTISVPLPPQAPPNGQFTIQIVQLGGDRTAVDGTVTSVPLLAGPPANIAVVTCNNYMVGDGYPVTNPQVNNHCGQFGDNQVTFEDVIVTLRAFGNVPGWTPGTDFPVCSDFFDALKAGPPDNANTPIKGQINITDLELTLNRWANLDPSRPTRLPGSYVQRESLLCAVPHDVQRSASLAGRSKRTPDEPAAGAVELGAVEVSGTMMRVPVYLRASQTITGLGIAIGWANPSTGPTLRFVNGALPAPGVLDTEVRGMLTAAWLQNIPAASGQPLLVGYVEWDRTRGVPSSPLQFFRVEGRGEDQMPLRLESRRGSLQ